jgi:hypothetical protein
VNAHCFKSEDEKGLGGSFGFWRRRLAQRSAINQDGRDFRFGDKLSFDEDFSVETRDASPGTTGRRNFALSMPVKSSSLECGSSIKLSRSSPPVCAIASTMRTPGMTGIPGKCP